MGGKKKKKTVGKEMVFFFENTEKESLNNDIGEVFLS